VSTVIEIEALSKAYRIGLKQRRPTTLAAASIDWIARPVATLRQIRRLDTFRLNANNAPCTSDILWALSNVSFSVQEGEVVGIIGRNGAGKSTLLKIISRITEPTAGRIHMRGRVSSLLEVGTGFHEELTGRENVYMNGTILGMTKREIDHKFDQIVDFSGVANFLETPIKRYSSGMKVRLAFAVAAHLDPEILIIDEVLAVGDAEFQKKCLGKMRDVAQGGRTVLFVSHNIPAVEQLTRRVVHLRNGRVETIGPTQDVIDSYLESFRDTDLPHGNMEGVSRQPAWLSRHVEFVQLDLDHPNGLYEAGDAICVDATVRINANINSFRISGTIFCSDGAPVGTFASKEVVVGATARVLHLEIPLIGLQLAPGDYFFGFSTGVGTLTTGHKDFDIIRECLKFRVAALPSDAGIHSVWPRKWGPVRFPAPTLVVH
jgi:lipopolysaccharide transport system ATP-binding protein